MLKEPGLEDGETLGTVTTGSGLMEHLGTTLTGPNHSQMITRVRKTVVALKNLMVDWLITNAARRERLFARKVKIIQYNKIK